MQAFEISDLLGERERSGSPFLEFIRSRYLSMGLYVLAAGQKDPQGLHAEDEVYYVVSGRAEIQVGDEVRAVAPGSVVFVGAEVDHRFRSITEELHTLALFSPPRRQLARPSQGSGLTRAASLS